MIFFRIDKKKTNDDVEDEDEECGRMRSKKFFEGKKNRFLPSLSLRRRSYMIFHHLCQQKTGEMERKIQAQARREEEWRKENLKSLQQIQDKHKHTSQLQDKTRRGNFRGKNERRRRTESGEKSFSNFFCALLAILDGWLCVKTRKDRKKGKIIQRETKRNERIKMVNLKASEKKNENGSLGKCQKSNKK